MTNLYHLTLLAVFLPLLGSAISGIAGKQLGPIHSHRLTIGCVGLACVVSFYLAKLVLLDKVGTSNEIFYTWASSGVFTFSLGFLIDPLTVVMMSVVCFVSLLVHIYSIGYMQGDKGYQRFFSYISLFTFAMLMLVTANNFLQLFFGWEAVGLVSYLLIGFWFHKESANSGSLKAFLVNRVGDFGFILGIAAVLSFFGSLDYAQVFAQAQSLNTTNALISIFPGVQWPASTVICLLLFVGAMGKSAQIPLHIWLPESMEGPTPISALIHAATMVTAGIFLVARMSPLFELSSVALSTVMVIGASGALTLGLLALVQFDIKRVVAYSTLSQLGYMMAAMGASAFSAGIFHLLTHACFKALLFLAAGSVIVATHHQQDMRQMGGLRKVLPLTYWTFLIGCLSLSAIPPFAGFYSKDVIIEAVQHADLPGADYAYVCVLLGAFVTAAYAFRALFMTFHGQPRMSADDFAQVHEPSWTIRLPLLILAVPSVGLGYVLIQAMLFSQPGLLGDALWLLPARDVLGHMAHEFHGPLNMSLTAYQHPAVWLALAGIFIAWLSYIRLPQLPVILSQKFHWLYRLWLAKYGFDALNQLIFVRGSVALAKNLYQIADVKFIDHWLVNGSGRLIGRLSAIGRKNQSGYLFWYAFVMVLGLVGFLLWSVVR